MEGGEGREKEEEGRGKGKGPSPQKKFWRRHCDDDDYTDSITNTKI